MVIGVIIYFFSGMNLNSSFSISAMKITKFGNGTISFILFSSTKLANPNSINIYINSIQNGLNTSNMSYNVSYSGGKYLYDYSGSISLPIESLLSTVTNPTLMISEINQNKKTIFTTTNILLKTATYSPLVNKITFYIFPPTTDFGISLTNYTSLIKNGQTVYLPNGVFTISAVQINPNSKLYFDFWNTTTYFGTIEITGGYKNPTTTLYLNNTSGVVSLFLNGYMNITFTSNNNTVINSQMNYTCGSANTRFCFDNSVKNLYYTYGENSSSFSFDYPPYVGNSSKPERYGFIGYVNNSYSCPISNKNSNVETNQFYQTSCIVNATYAPEYYISANTANLTRGLVAIQFFNGTQTSYSSFISGYAKKGSTNEFLAESNIDYAFVNWTGTYYSTSNQYSTIITEPTNETANFKISPPNITFESNYGGASVSISVNSNSIGKETVPYVYTFNNFTKTYNVNWTWTQNVNGYNFSSESFGCETPSSSSSSANGIYNFDNTCQNYIVLANYTPPPSPPQPPPSSGPYYIYGIVINSSTGAYIQSLNGTSFTIPAGHFNTSLTSNKSQIESTYAFPSGGYTGSGASFNVATKLVSGSNIYQLQSIVGVGFCGTGGLTCSNSYTPWISYYGGSNRIAQYTCSGPSCPIGSGGGNGGGINEKGSPTYNFTFKNVNCIYESGVSSTNCNNNLVSGQLNVSLSPAKYSATYINLNHPTLDPPPTSVVSYIEYYPHNNSYEYEFVKSAQKIVYTYPHGSLEGYAYCWLNSTQNSTTMPITSVYVGSNYEINGSICQTSGSLYFAIMNITSSAYYTLIGKISTITVYNYPGNVNGDYVSLGISSGTGTLKKINNQTLQSGNGTINETTYEVGINPTIKSYTVNITYTRTNADPYYNYLLLIKNETTGTIVPITGLTKVGNYYNATQYQQITLNSSDNYNIYAIYFIPITIETDFLGQPTSLNEYGLKIEPYQTNLIRNNTNEPTTKTNEIYYALPAYSSYLPDYSTYTYNVEEGFWNNGRFNATKGVTYPQICFAALAGNQTGAGEVKYCFATTGSSSFTEYRAGFNFSEFTGTDSYYQTYGSYKHALSSLHTYDGFYYAGKYNNYTMLNFSYVANTTIMNGLSFYKPTTIKLNYGYYIPFFIYYNDYYLGIQYTKYGQVGNCNNADIIYYGVIDFITSLINDPYGFNFLCLTSIETPTATLYQVLITKPNSVVYINLPDHEYSLQNDSGIYNITTENLTGFYNSTTSRIYGNCPQGLYEETYPTQITISTNFVPYPTDAYACGAYSTIK